MSFNIDHQFGPMPNMSRIELEFELVEFFEVLRLHWYMLFNF